MISVVRQAHQPWVEVLLQDVISILGDGLHGTPKYDDNGDFYFINGNNLSNGKIVIKPETKKTSVEEYNKYKKNLNDRTILLSINGTLGNIAYYNGEKCVLGKSACYFNVLNDVDKDFIRYVVTGSHFQNYIDTLAHGSTIKNVSLKTIREYPVLLPPLPEQKAIAGVLSSLDDKIDLLHKQNKTLEGMAETLWRKMFVVEADLKWPLDILDNLFDIGIGRTPPRKEQHWFTVKPSDVKWISIKDMGNCGVYIDSVAEYLTKEAVEKFHVPIIPINTVLLSFKMTVGRLAITTEDMISNEAIAHFKIKDQSVLNSEFLYFFLKNYSFENLGSTSSIVEAINSQMIKEMEMLVPPKELLIDFRNIVAPYFLKIKTNQQQIRSLSKMRDDLLSKLMCGEVRVKL